MTDLNQTKPTTTPMQVDHTEAGEQLLVPGISPITLRDRLQTRLDAPLTPPCRQKPLNVGLWDEDARNQLELF